MAQSTILHLKSFNYDLIFTVKISYFIITLVINIYWLVFKLSLLPVPL